MPAEEMDFEIGIFGKFWTYMTLTLTFTFNQVIGHTIVYQYFLCTDGRTDGRTLRSTLLHRSSSSKNMP